jgi:hypothetical protein
MRLSSETPARVEIGEAEVVALEPSEGVRRVGRKRVAGLERARHLAQSLELGVMLGDATLGIVRRGPGGDQELPVRGLEQQELARGLRDHATQLGPAVEAAEMADPLGFGAVHAVPGPLGTAVEPHAMVAALAPRAFRQRQRRARRYRFERLPERHPRDAAPLHLAGDVLQPRGALEPPVPEELCVVG